MSPTLPPKKEVALALIERSDLFVHLDPRIDGVVVPSWFRKQPELVLRVGLNMAVPIPDLRFDDDGVTCTLSFNRAPFYCVLPWAAIFGLRGEDGMGLIWPEDVPREVREGAQAQAKAKPAAKLSVVKDSSKEPASKASEPKASDAKVEKAEKADKTPSSRSARGRTSEKMLSSEKTGASSERNSERSEKAERQSSDRQSARELSAKDKEPKEPKERVSERGLTAASAAKLEKADKEGADSKSEKAEKAATPSAPKAVPAPADSKSGKAAATTSIGDDDTPPDSPPVMKNKKPKRELPPYLRVIK